MGGMGPQQGPGLPVPSSPRPPPHNMPVVLGVLGPHPQAEAPSAEPVTGSLGQCRGLCSSGTHTLPTAQRPLSSVGATLGVEARWEAQAWWPAVFSISHL